MPPWLMMLGGLFSNLWTNNQNQQMFQQSNQWQEDLAREGLARLDAVNLSNPASTYGNTFTFGGLSPTGGQATSGFDLAGFLQNPLYQYDPTGAYTGATSGIFDWGTGSLTDKYDPSTGYAALDQSLTDINTGTLDSISDLTDEAKGDITNIIGTGIENATGQLNRLDPGSLFASIEHLLPEYTGDAYKTASLASAVESSKANELLARQSAVSGGFGSGKGLQEISANILPSLGFAGSLNRASAAQGILANVEGMKQQQDIARFNTAGSLAAKEADVNAFIDAKAADLIAQGSFETANNIRSLTENEIQEMRLSKDNLVNSLTQTGIAQEEAERLASQWENEFIDSMASKKAGLVGAQQGLSASVNQNALNAWQNWIGMLGGWQQAFGNQQLAQAGAGADILGGIEQTLLPYQDPFQSMMPFLVAMMQSQQQQQQSSPFGLSIGGTGFSVG